MYYNSCSSETIYLWYSSKTTIKVTVVLYIIHEQKKQKKQIFCARIHFWYINSIPFQFAINCINFDVSCIIEKVWFSAWNWYQNCFNCSITSNFTYCFLKYHEFTNKILINSYIFNLILIFYPMHQFECFLYPLKREIVSFKSMVKLFESLKYIKFYIQLFSRTWTWIWFGVKLFGCCIVSFVCCPYSSLFDWIIAEYKKTTNTVQSKRYKHVVQVIIQWSFCLPDVRAGATELRIISISSSAFANIRKKQNSRKITSLQVQQSQMNDQRSYLLSQT